LDITNPVLKCLLGGAQSVILSANEATGRGMVNRKIVVEREYESAFSIAIEIHSFNKWVVYSNAVNCVDALLSGDIIDDDNNNSVESMAEIREMDENGRVSIICCKCQDVEKLLSGLYVEQD
jgi:hypothetical protein